MPSRLEGYDSGKRKQVDKTNGMNTWCCFHHVAFYANMVDQWRSVDQKFGEEEKLGENTFSTQQQGGCKLPETKRGVLPQALRTKFRLESYEGIWQIARQIERLLC